MSRRLFTALSLAFICATLAARADAADIALRAGNDVYYLRGVTQMLEVPRKSDSPVESIAHARGWIPFGPMPHARSAYWVRFTVSADVPSRNEWYFFLGYKPAEVDFYAPAANGGFVAQRSGSAIPFRERPVKAYGWVSFELPVDTKPRTYYARIETTEPNLTLAIDARSFFWALNQRQLLMIVGLGSVLLALGISSLILFGIARRRVYLYYAAYLFAQLLYRANDVGVAAAYFWPHSATSWTRVNVVFDGLTVLTATLFVRAFLRLRRVSPVLDRLNVGIAAIASAYVLAAIAGAPIQLDWVWNFGYVYVPIWLVSGVAAWREGEEQAKFFLLAWVALMAGIVVSDLKQLGVGRGNFNAEFFLSHGPYFGIAVQSMFLSLALAIELRALTNAKAFFESLATTDSVTGIANRRAFDEVLHAQFDRTARLGWHLSVLMLDVDFFKPFNDLYGHNAGDECLRAVARAGTQCVKDAGGTFCRFGGEEFAAVLPNADRQRALVIAESIRTSIADLGIGHERSSAGYVTVSVGVAFVIPELVKTESALLKIADDALYRAKANGRNRVVAENYETAAMALSIA